MDDGTKWIMREGGVDVERSLPCTPDPLSVDALLATVKELRTLGTDRFRMLLTIVPPRPNRDGPKAREALLEAGLPLFQAQIPRLVSFQRCILDGDTVYSPEYGEVAEESRISGQSASRIGE